MSRAAEPIRYGQVWVSRDEVMGPMNYLVVSSDAYNAAFGDRRVIAVEVDSRSVYQGTYREPIVEPAPHCLTGWSGLPEACLRNRSPSCIPNGTPRWQPRSASSSGTSQAEQPPGRRLMSAGRSTAAVDQDRN